MTNKFNIYTLDGRGLFEAAIVPVEEGSTDIKYQMDLSQKGTQYSCVKALESRDRNALFGQMENVLTSDGSCEESNEDLLKESIVFVDFGDIFRNIVTEDDINNTDNSGDDKDKSDDDEATDNSGDDKDKSDDNEAADNSGDDKDKSDDDEAADNHIDPEWEEGEKARRAAEDARWASYASATGLERIRMDSESLFDRSDFNNEDDYYEAKEFYINRIIEERRAKISGKKYSEIEVDRNLQVLFDKGIRISFGGKHKKFVPFDKSGSMSRQSRITFIAEEIKVEVEKRLLLGIEFKDLGDISLSKFYAYRGLYLSSGVEIISDSQEEKNGLTLNSETVVILPDVEYSVNESDKGTLLEGKLKEGKGKRRSVTFDRREVYEEKKEKQDTINIFDGEGLISLEYAKLIRSVKQKWSGANSFQIRLPFTKGVLHTVDFHGFIEEYGTKEGKEFYVKDIFGKERNLKEAHIILTESMFKIGGWLKAWQDHCNNTKDEEIFDDPAQYYFDKVRDYKFNLYVTGTDAPYVGKQIVQTNYQILNTLGLNKDNFDTLLSQYKYIQNDSVKIIDIMKNIAVAKSDDEEYEDDEVDANATSDAESNETQIVDDNAETPDDLSNNEEDEAVTYNTDNESNNSPGEAAADNKASQKELVDLLEKYPVFLRDSYVKGQIKAYGLSLLGGIIKGHILVDGQVRYLSKDLLYLLYSILENNNPENEKLEKISKECDELTKSHFYGPGIEELKAFKESEYYSIFRNPHLSRNEQCALKLYVPKDSIRKKYLSHLRGTVMFAYNSLDHKGLGGADFDGDTVRIISNDIITKAVLKKSYEKKGDKGNEDYIRKLPIIDIIAPKPEVSSYSGNIEYSVIKDTFTNQIGLISNMAVTIGGLIYNDEFIKKLKAKKGEEKAKKMEKLCALCTVYTGMEIDAAKNGVRPELSNLIEKQNELLEYAKEFKFISGDTYKSGYLRYLKRFKGFEKAMHMHTDKDAKPQNIKRKVRVKIPKEFKELTKEGLDFLPDLFADIYEKDIKIKAPKGKLFGFEDEKNWKEFSKEGGKRWEDYNKILAIISFYAFFSKYINGVRRSYNFYTNKYKGGRSAYKIYRAQRENYGKLMEDLHQMAETLQSAYMTESGESEKFKKLMEEYSNRENSEWPYLYDSNEKVKYLQDKLGKENYEKIEGKVNCLFDFTKGGYTLFFKMIMEIRAIFYKDKKYALKDGLNYQRENKGANGLYEVKGDLVCEKRGNDEIYKSLINSVTDYVDGIYKNTEDKSNEDNENQKTSGWDNVWDNDIIKLIETFIKEGEGKSSEGNDNFSLFRNAETEIVRLCKRLIKSKISKDCSEEDEFRMIYMATKELNKNAFFWRYYTIDDIYKRAGKKEEKEEKNA